MSALLIELVVPALTCIGIGYALGYFRFRWRREVISQEALASLISAEPATSVVVDLGARPQIADPAAVDVGWVATTSPAPLETSPYGESKVAQPVADRAEDVTAAAVDGGVTQGKVLAAAPPPGLARAMQSIDLQHGPSVTDQSLVSPPSARRSDDLPGADGADEIDDAIVELLRSSARRRPGTDSRRSDIQNDVDQAREFLERLRAEAAGNGLPAPRGNPAGIAGPDLLAESSDRLA